MKNLQGNTMEDERVRHVVVDGNRVGIVGLKQAFEKLAENYHGMSDEALADELFLTLSKKNYIPPKAKDAYAKAFLREFKKFVGLPVKEETSDNLEIKVLGTGCPQCDGLEQSLIQICSELGIKASIDHVRDPEEIRKYKAFALPALVINGHLKSMGLVPPPPTLRQWLREYS